MVLRSFLVLLIALCLGTFCFGAHAFAEDVSLDAGVADAAITDVADAGDAPAEEDPDHAAPSNPLEFHLPLLGQTTFGMTSTTWARYRGNNYDSNIHDDSFLSLQQRFDLSLQGEELRADLRLDGFLPVFFDHSVSTSRTCPPGQETLCYLGGDARPERFSLSWNHNEWTVIGGDHYAVIGRGLALSFRKYDLLGLDESLRGGFAQYQSHRITVRGMGGISNPQNLDPTTLALIRDPHDLVGGGEISTRLGANDEIDFGVHMSHVNFEDDVSSAQSGRQANVFGWHASMPQLFSGKLALYVEADALTRTWQVGSHSRNDNGRAVYASAQLQLEKATLLTEWVDYRNFLVAPSISTSQSYRIYSSMPTMELDGFLLQIRDVGNRRGGSMKFDYAFLPGPWSFALNALIYGLNDADLDPWNGTLVTHGWAAIRRNADAGDRHAWNFELIGGYRRETYLWDPAGTIGKGDVDRESVHGTLTASLAAGTHSFDFRVDHLSAREWRVAAYSKYVLGGASLTWTYATKFSVAPMVRWNTEQQSVIESRAMHTYNFMGGKFYPSIEARWNFSSAMFLSVFVGSTPAGHVCSGGVCRDVPAFEGAIGQFVFRL